MSWDVTLLNAGPVERFEDGGTYPLGGEDQPRLNITYNYSPHYYAYLDADHGLRAMNGQHAGDWIQRLHTAVEALGTDRVGTTGNLPLATRVLPWPASCLGQNSTLMAFGKLSRLVHVV